MGANWSDIEDSSSPMATTTVTTVPAVYTPTYNKASASRWSTLPETNVPPSFQPSRYDNRPVISPPEKRQPVHAHFSPVPPPVVFNPNYHRVKAFHCNASWSAYFEASKVSNHLVVIDFTAAWCGPCRYMEPFINELASKYTDIEFVKIDVDELFNVSRHFGIQTMPTFVLLKKGKEVDRVTGARKEDLQRKIEIHRI